MRLTTEKQKLNFKCEDIAKLLGKKDEEIKNLDKACRLSMNQTKANSKFLGASIIMKSLKVGHGSCNNIRNAIKYWHSQMCYQRKMDSVYHKIMKINTKHIQARISAAFLIINQFTKN